jgi:hypothetical protein
MVNKLNNSDKKLFILPHQGLGDQLVLCQYVKEFIPKYKNVVLVIKNCCKDSLQHLYSDESNLIFYEINDDKEISPNYGYPEKDSLLSLLQQLNFDKHFHYSHALEPIAEFKTVFWTFPEIFYKEFGLDPSLRYNFTVKRNHDAELKLYNKLVEKIGKDYIVIHDDKERNFVMRNKPSDLPKFYIGLGTKSELDYLKSSNIFDYLLLLEKAQEIHIFDSFLALLIDLLNLSCQGKIIFHTYLRTGDPRLYKADYVYIN